eukprot:762903-Hanusia_phi.AAC.3
MEYGNMECPLTPIFPAHERYPLPVHGYFFAVGFFFLFTVISSILTCKLFQFDFVRHVPKIASDGRPLSKCTVNPSDPSPYLEGRNVDRLYPYVQRGDTTCTRELTNVSSLEVRVPSFATFVGIVIESNSYSAAQITSLMTWNRWTGMVLYEDHPAFTEHFSIAAHARRMGRPVLMYTRGARRFCVGIDSHLLSTAVARHANLLLYGETFHDNSNAAKHSKSFKHDVPLELSDRWTKRVSLAYCDKAFRDNWWERPCIVIPTSKECSANSRGKRTGLIHPLLELELQMTATTMLQQSSAIGWVGANSHLLGTADCNSCECCNPHLQGSTQAIVYKSARDNISFYGANMTDLAIDKPGIYRFRAWFKYESQLVEGYSQTFLVGSGMQHLISRQLWNTDQCQCLEDECVIVFSHSRQHSPTSEVQLLDSLQQAKERYGPSWQIHVWGQIENLGGKVLAADQLQGHGEMTWAFWPFLAFEGGAKKKRRIIVREAGYCCFCPLPLVTMLFRHDVVQREVDAVKQWIISAKALHTMRDSLLHSRPFNSRLWGCIAPCEIRGRPLVEVRLRASVLTLTEGNAGGEGFSVEASRGRADRRMVWEHSDASLFQLDRGEGAEGAESRALIALAGHP